MVIGYEKIALVLMLHLNRIAHHAKIITQVQVARRSYPAYYSIHPLSFIIHRKPTLFLINKQYMITCPFSFYYLCKKQYDYGINTAEKSIQAIAEGAG
jgi:hypothetical protein